MKIQQKIIVPVVAILMCSVAVLSLTNYYTAKSALYETHDSNIRSNLESIARQMDLSDNIISVTLKNMDANNLALARSLAEIVKNSPQMLDEAQMIRIANILRVDEVHVTDENGILHWGNIPGYYGFDFKTTEQTEPFLEILSDPSVEVAQEPQPNGAEGKLFQYIGVSRADAKGIVQVGRMADDVENVKNLMSINNNIKNTKIGQSGYMFIMSNGAIVSHPDASKIGKDVSGEPWYGALADTGKNGWVDIDGGKFYAGAMSHNGEMIAAILPYSEIMSGLSSIRNTSMLYSLMAFVVMVAALTIVVPRIMRPLVKLGSDMERISYGDIGISLASNSRDEIGRLTNDAAKILSVLQMFINDISEMSRNYNELGNIGYEIDESRYEGGFRSAAAALNASFKASHDDLMKIVSSLENVSEGDFDFNLPAMPGKKAIVAQSIGNICQEIKSTIGDIHSLVKEAELGRLDARLRPDSYKGGWGQLCVQLNALLDRVTGPIKETMAVMAEISNGNLGVTIQGDYHGDFLALKNSINATAGNVSEYVGEISSTLSDIADRVFNKRIVKDFIGDYAPIKASLNAIIDMFNGVLHDISDASMQIDANARRMSGISAGLAENASGQSALMEGIVTSSSEISAKSTGNADDASQAEALARATAEDAARGNSEMDHMIGAMQNIKDASDNISKIIKTIEDIALQTNLLALNASVEASRAGAVGKGFAVVANEVRSLSVKSSQAAKETAELIEDSLNKVSAGTATAEHTAEALRKISESVGQMKAIITKIVASSHEQAREMNEVNVGFGKISDGIASSTAVSQEAAASASELSEQSSAFKGMLSGFTFGPRQKNGAGTMGIELASAV